MYLAPPFLVPTVFLFLFSVFSSAVLTSKASCEERLLKSESLLAEAHVRIAFLQQTIEQKEQALAQAAQQHTDTKQQLRVAEELGAAQKAELNQFQIKITEASTALNEVRERMRHKSGRLSILDHLHVLFCL